MRTSQHVNVREKNHEASHIATVLIQYADAEDAYSQASTIVFDLHRQIALNMTCVSYAPTTALFKVCDYRG